MNVGGWLHRSKSERNEEGAHMKEGGRDRRCGRVDGRRAGHWVGMGVSW